MKVESVVECKHNCKQLCEVFSTFLILKPTNLMLWLSSETLTLRHISLYFWTSLYSLHNRVFEKLGPMLSCEEDPGADQDESWEFRWKDIFVHIKLFGCGIVGGTVQMSSSLFWFWGALVELSTKNYILTMNLKESVSGRSARLICCVSRSKSAYYEAHNRSIWHCVEEIPGFK